MKTKLAEFKHWLDTANIGQVYIYYTGHLAVDRGTIVDMHIIGAVPLFIPNGEVDGLGRAAIEAWEADKVHLFQRKIHDNEYQYIAMKRSRHNFRGYLKW